MGGRVRVGGSLPALLCALMLACGSPATSVTPPPPPPPPPPPAGAASVSIVAGDNQSAAPNAVVSVRPSVIVKDAAGAPVSGVTVTFSVDAGGGAVTGATAVTGSDGIATVGQWTLGSSAGSNALKVTVGSLAPIIFHATAVGAPITALADVTVPTTGGTITVNASGNPLNGLSITVPSGAYNTPAHWTITPATGPTPTLPANVTLAVPSFRISTGQGISAKPMTLRIPVQLAATQFAGAFYYDQSSGAIEAMPVVGRDASSITVLVRHFTSDLLLKPAAAGGLRAASLRAFGDVVVIVPQTDLAELDKPISSGFAPGVDDWEFVNHGSYLAPGGHCAGQSITALWYYYTHRAEGTLYHKFDRINTNGYWIDNPLGYRFASVAQNVLDWTSASALIAAMDSYASASTFGRDKLNFYSLALSLLMTHQPQFLAMHQSTPTPGHAIIGYATLAGVVSVADPNFPGTIRRIVFQNGAFQPYPSQPHADAATELYDVIRLLGVSAMLPLDVLEAQWTRFKAGTVGDDHFPAMQLQVMAPDSSWSNAQDPIVTSMQDIRLRLLCTTCSFASPAPGAAPKMQLVGVDDDAGHSLEVTQDGLGVDFRAPAGTQTIALSYWGAATNPAVAGFEWGYANFKRMTLVSAPFQVTPDPASGAIGVPVSFVSRPWGRAPTQARYVWTFNDGSAPVTVLGDSAVTHTFTASGALTVRVDLFDNATGKLYGRAQGLANIASASSTWRTTAFTNTALNGSTTVQAALEAFPNTFYGSDRTYFSTINFNLQFGYIVQYPGGTVPGLGAEPTSIWVMFRGDGQTALSGTYTPRLLARTPVASGSSAPVPNHAVASTGTATAGTISGNYSQDFTLSNGTASCVLSNVTGNITGNTLSGTFTRAYRLTPCSVAATAGSTWTITYTFTGVKTP